MIVTLLLVGGRFNFGYHAREIIGNMDLTLTSNEHYDLLQMRVTIARLLVIYDFLNDSV